MSIKVLYVISTLGGGGAESQLCTFLESLSNSSNKFNQEVITYVIALKEGGVFEKKLVQLGINYSIVNGNIIHQICFLSKFIKSNRVEIVHSHMLYSDLVTRIVKIFTKFKHISTHHGLGFWKKKSLIMIERITSPLVNGILCVSDESYKIRHQRDGYSLKKLYRIKNGIILPRIDYYEKSILDKKSITIGMLARFTKNKQIDLAILILKELSLKYNVRLELVGSGEEMDNIIKLIDSLNVKDKVVLHGWLDEPSQIYKNWDFNLLCSLHEDLPLSVIETMSYGIVQVTTNVGGLNELLDFGNNGKLCNPREIITFIKAFTEIIDNPYIYNLYSKNCINYVNQNFDISKIVLETIQIYRKVMK